MLHRYWLNKNVALQKDRKGRKNYRHCVCNIFPLSIAFVVNTVWFENLYEYTCMSFRNNFHYFLTWEHEFMIHKMSVFRFFSSAERPDSPVYRPAAGIHLRCGDSQSRHRERDYDDHHHHNWGEVQGSGTGIHARNVHVRLWGRRR